MNHYTLFGETTGGYYLVHVQDQRYYLYPPASFRVRINHSLVEPYGYEIVLPYEGREITAPWPWWSRRRARRLVRKAERRVARGMQAIYRRPSRIAS